MSTRPSYTVAVGDSWHASDGSPAPDRTCGHRHTTLDAATRCQDALIGARYEYGSWQCNATWYTSYIINNATGHKVRP